MFLFCSLTIYLNHLKKNRDRNKIHQSHFLYKAIHICKYLVYLRVHIYKDIKLLNPKKNTKTILLYLKCVEEQRVYKNNRIVSRKKNVCRTTGVTVEQ